MRKIPYGISNYEELVNDGYYYIDKTKYIEQLENLGEKRIIIKFLALKIKYMLQFTANFKFIVQSSARVIIYF